MARKFSLVRAGVYLLALVGGVSLPAAASIPAPSYITQWGESGSGPGQLLYPRGIAVGPNGNVYVTDHGNNRVQVFTSNGDFVTQWGSYGSGNGQFFSPWGIAVDGDGNV